MKKKSKEFKIGFFNRIVLSVTNFESYIIIATEKVSRSFLYIMGLLIIFSLTVSIALSIKTTNMIENDDETMNKIYNQVVERYSFTEIGKEELISLIKGNSETETFFKVFGITIFVVFGMYFVSTLIDVFALSLVGLIMCKIVFIPLKYKAVLNMAASSITLSIILNVIYLLLNISTGYTINNFQIMYTAIAYIYIITSILILRTELIKKDSEKKEKIKNNNEAQE